MIVFWIIGKKFYVMMDRILQHTNVVVGTRKINFFLIRFASNDVKWLMNSTLMGFVINGDLFKVMRTTTICVVIPGK